MVADTDIAFMRRAIEVAELGRGHVEPNPLVGCVLTHKDQVIGEGHHQDFGGPHAEVVALNSLQGGKVSTAYVTLEPCCHHGKTPACTAALIAAGIKRVVVAAGDTYYKVAGEGIEQLRQAGIEVEVGLLNAEAQIQNAPYFKLLRTGLPWISAKWAMTLDGKIATKTGDSKWISNELARAKVHAIRGCMDAILVGIGTALVDDPQLTARPAGPRVPTRIILDRFARLPILHRLVKSCRETPVIVFVGHDAPKHRTDALSQAGVEIIAVDTSTVFRTRSAIGFLSEVLSELGRRQMTNVLVEGGGEVLGSFLDGNWIDEVHVFIAPQLIGGRTAKSPIAGQGAEQISQGLKLVGPVAEYLGDNIYVSGRVDAE